MLISRCLVHFENFYVCRKSTLKLFLVANEVFLFFKSEVAARNHVLPTCGFYFWKSHLKEASNVASLHICSVWGSLSVPYLRFPDSSWCLDKVGEVSCLAVMIKRIKKSKYLLQPLKNAVVYCSKPQMPQWCYVYKVLLQSHVLLL